MNHLHFFTYLLLPLVNKPVLRRICIARCLGINCVRAQKDRQRTQQSSSQKVMHNSLRKRRQPDYCSRSSCCKQSFSLLPSLCAHSLWTKDRPRPNENLPSSQYITNLSQHLPQHKLLQTLNQGTENSQSDALAQGTHKLGAQKSEKLRI